LKRRLRSKVDSTDIAQMAWASFFRVLPDHRFDTPEHLVAFLTSITRNKFNETLRRFLGTQARDIRREQSLGEDAADNPEMMSTDRPEERTLARDTWQEWLDRCNSGERLLLIWVREGCSHAEIADRLNARLGTTMLDEKSVRQALRALRSRLQHAASA
jgi:RNA polymerase sigma factor (sigma-70 family)